MKPTADGSLLAVLQSTVSTTLKQWLDDNKVEFLRVAREAILDKERTKPEQQHMRSGHFLTVAELALRWHLNPETVRRMTRAVEFPAFWRGGIIVWRLQP